MKLVLFLCWFLGMLFLTSCTTIENSTIQTTNKGIPAVVSGNPWIYGPPQASFIAPTYYTLGNWGCGYAPSFYVGGYWNRNCW